MSPHSLSSSADYWFAFSIVFLLKGKGPTKFTTVNGFLPRGTRILMRLDIFFNVKIEYFGDSLLFLFSVLWII